jgi:flagellar basal body-associated protein FliL
MQEEQQVEKKYQDNGEEISLSEAYIHSLDEFVSNIASEDGSSSNFIKLKIDLVFNQSEVSEEILSKFNSYFSDIVLTTVSEKNFEFLNTYSGKNELKIELKEKFNQLFSQIEDDIEIKKILFKSFVIQ